jgi:hypothetical protein
MYFFTDLSCFGWLAISLGQWSGVPNLFLHISFGQIKVTYQKPALSVQVDWKLIKRSGGYAISSYPLSGHF